MGQTLDQTDDIAEQEAITKREYSQLKMMEDTHR